MLAALERHASAHLAAILPKSPAGGYYIWLKMNKPTGYKELVDACIREGVLVQPGSIYGADRGYVRLTYASTDDDSITEAIRRLGNALARA